MRSAGSGSETLDTGSGGASATHQIDPTPMRCYTVETRTVEPKLKYVPQISLSDLEPISRSYYDRTHVRLAAPARIRLCQVGDSRVFRLHAQNLLR